MKLNCKAGDLARFVKPGPLQDRIIRVTSLDPHPACVEPCWFYEGPRIETGDFGDYISFRDSVLRPIANPGEDARDESLAWKPVPTELPERTRA